MSRSYRVCVAESVSRHIQVEDGVQTGLEVLEVLPRERMSAILAAELEKRGFTIDSEKMTATRTEEDGIEIAVDLSNGTVTAKISGEKDVEIKKERAEHVDVREKDSAEERLRARVRADLETEVTDQKERLRQEVTAKLEKKLGDLKRELDGISTRVTADALKERASQLGTIEEMHEDGNGNMTIKVRV
jgi:hypothetical protein